MEEIKDYPLIKPTIITNILGFFTLSAYNHYLIDKNKKINIERNKQYNKEIYNAIKNTSFKVEIY